MTEPFPPNQPKIYVGREGKPQRHREAFCLMKYRADDEIIWVWNSRDGVTPFTFRMPGVPQHLGDRPKDRMFKHVDWHEDVFVPNYIPAIGTWIFVDSDPVSKQPALRQVTAGDQLSYAERATNIPFAPFPYDPEEYSKTGMLRPCV